MSKVFTGTYTALVTPMNEDLSIDFESFQKLLDFQIQSGVDGVVVSGSTGEAATLSIKEKISLYVFAVEHCKGKIKVIAGSGTNSTQETIDITLLAKEHGCDGALLVAPYYNKPSQEGLYNHYRAVADAVDIPIILYNIPSRAGVNIDPGTIARLAADCTNIVSVKDASADLELMMQIIASVPDDFSLLSGDDALTLPVIAIGGDGCIGVLPNYLPKQFNEMIKLALAGKISDANKINYELLPFYEINFIETNPVPVKAITTMLGMTNEFLRLPLVPATAETKAQLKDYVNRIKEIM